MRIINSANQHYSQVIPPVCTHTHTQRQGFWNLYYSHIWYWEWKD